jgi:hypothetical protein
MNRTPAASSPRCLALLDTLFQSGRDPPVCRAASGDCYQGMGPRLLIEGLGR